MIPSRLARLARRKENSLTGERERERTQVEVWQWPVNTPSTNRDSKNWKIEVGRKRKRIVWIDFYCVQLCIQHTCANHYTGSTHMQDHMADLDNENTEGDSENHGKLRPQKSWEDMKAYAQNAEISQPHTLQYILTKRSKEE